LQAKENNTQQALQNRANIHFRWWRIFVEICWEIV
jgi:hypothetical protein